MSNHPYDPSPFEIRRRPFHAEDWDIFITIGNQGRHRVASFESLGDCEKEVKRALHSARSEANRRIGELDAENIALHDALTDHGIDADEILAAREAD